MPGGADSPRVSPIALVPVALVAIVVVGVALLVRGGQAPTIVVQRMMLTGLTSEGRKIQRAPISTYTEISEASADGTLLRSFIEDSISRPGFQQVTTPSMTEIYDPIDNTIFETSYSAYQRAVNLQVERVVGNGRGHVQSASRHAVVAYGDALVPGRMSLPQQQLLAHQARVIGRVRIDGRPALELVARPYFAAGMRPAAGYRSVITEYVAPRTYDPIEQITRSTFPGLRETIVTWWRGYRVLPDTAISRRLLSLTDRHPTARVVDSAPAYIRATQSEIRTFHVFKVQSATGSPRTTRSGSVSQTITTTSG